MRQFQRFQKRFFSSITEIPSVPHLKSKTNDYLPPEALLFSDKVIFKQKITTGALISLFASQKNLNIPANLLNQQWEKSIELINQRSPLYIPGEKLSILHHKNWIMEVLESTLHPFIKFGSPLQDDILRDQLKYRVYKNLIDSRTYFIEKPIIKFLQKLQVGNIPVGLIANSFPQFESIIEGIEQRIKTKKPLLSTPNKHFLPFVNAAENGIAKPDPKIFLEILKKMSLKSPENIYYVGVDPLLDYAPSRTLGIKSVLLTSNFSKPMTDIKYLSPRLCREKTSFRIADIQELERVVLPKEIYKKPYRYRK